MTNGTPETQRWWSDWYLVHKLDSMEERAFLGYLTTHGHDRLALSPSQLDTQWAAFQAYWLASTAP
jgi:hypothetical protein